MWPIGRAARSWCRPSRARARSSTISRTYGRRRNGSSGGPAIRSTKACSLGSIMAEAPPAFTPVTLVTGFLGSGKTTLLQRLLREPAFADTAVLINELGEIALDHHLLERIDE